MNPTIRKHIVLVDQLRLSRASSSPDDQRALLDRVALLDRLDETNERMTHQERRLVDSLWWRAWPNEYDERAEHGKPFETYVVLLDKLREWRRQPNWRVEDDEQLLRDSMTVWLTLTGVEQKFADSLSWMSWPDQYDAACS